jgi:hypothetical protein
MESIVNILSSGNQLAGSNQKKLARSSFQVAVPPPPPQHELFLTQPAFPHELEIRKSLTFYNRLTSYNLPTPRSEDPQELPDELPEVVNPIVQADRDKALKKINEMLSTINTLKQDFQTKQEKEVVCPYEKTKIEYLGSNFIVPTIQDLTIPVNFCEKIAANSTLVIGRHYTDLMITKLQQMSAEAADPSFEGIKTQALGNAFSVLSATAQGEMWVEDRKKTAAHLEFAEIVRNIPIKDILEDPITIAKKLLTRFMEINSECLANREEANSVWEFLSKKSLNTNTLSKQSLDFGS